MGQCIGLAALALLLGNRGLQNAVAEGDTRTISLHHIHTGEDLTITYKRDGRYDEEALKKVDHLLRDWRRDQEIHMDPRLLDVVWEVYREVDAKGPIQVVCGYRSPATNAMLRRRSRGVAEYSQHMLGHAMDFFIPGVPLEKQREAGLRLERGGVGYYPSSGSPFVHMDVGNVRMWPRMSREQLARVFPDGRTVLIPSDGRPLAGYALALADIEKRGSSEPSQMSLEAARAAGVDTPARPHRNLFASLFNAKDEDEAEAAEPSPAPAEPAAAKSPDAKAPKAVVAQHVPLPVPRPTLRIAAKTAPKTAPKAAPAAEPAFNLASAESRPVALTTPRVADAAAPPANDVIADRGYWQQPAAPAPPQLAAASPAPLRDAQRPAAEATGTVTPWPVKTADATDHVPPELALAYAAQARTAPVAAPVTRGLTVGAAPQREAATMMAPRAVAAAKPAPTAPVAAAAPALKPGTPLEDPWLRALVLAPNLQSYMTATLLGQPDMRELKPLMAKPDAVVTMGFGDDPLLGLATDHFSGNAVVFVSTVTFEKRTAALQ